MCEPFRGAPAEEIERKTANAVTEGRDQRFAVIDQMRETFKDIPAEEIERTVVAIIREMREASEVTIIPEGKATVERRPA